jgi:hypothetical protein
MRSVEPQIRQRHERRVRSGLTSGKAAALRRERQRSGGGPNGAVSPVATVGLFRAPMYLTH